ncbi:MAG: flagellar export protein FliJ [Bacillota bacterium]
MKKFSFRLEPVLKNRTDKEERAIVAQSAAQKEYLDQTGMLDKISRDLSNAREAVSGKMTVEEFLSRSLYIDYLAASLTKQESVVEKARRELEKKRQAVIQARKDKLVLQKLKEKLYQDHIQQVSLWEAKFTDDQCTSLSHRRKGG